MTASMQAFRGRSVVGVACDGKRAIIVGGLTCASGGHEPLQLADVWEFHFAEECWVQARLYIICRCLPLIFVMFIKPHLHRLPLYRYS